MWKMVDRLLCTGRLTEKEELEVIELRRKLLSGQKLTNSEEWKLNNLHYQYCR